MRPMVHGILQARILEWAAFPSPADLPDPGIEPGSLALQANFLPTELPGKKKKNQWSILCWFKNMSSVLWFGEGNGTPL